MRMILFIVAQLFAQNDCLSFLPKKRHVPWLQVTVTQGTMQGNLRRTKEQNINYFSFQGIPYAIPPVRELRFKHPVPFEKWEGVLDTTKDNVSSCIQILPTFFSDHSESEDCLYLHVFTPVQVLSKANVIPLVPVMVWIHGGGFLIGSPNYSDYGPDYLLEAKTVVVQIGYRLSSFGFLSTEDMESPGNYGLKDQQLALRWIKENIKYFGGDADRITIFGESAGGASVQYQLLYPKNEGLFQGAISESGSALCFWAFQRHPRKIAFDLGHAAGIKTDSSKQLMDYLRNLPVEKLKTATMTTTVLNSLGFLDGLTFAPTIEPVHQDAFLTNKTHQLLRDGKFIKVPHIIGYNSEEASIVKAAMTFANPLLQRFKIDQSVLVPRSFNADEDKQAAGKDIYDYYFRNPRMRSEQYLQFVNDADFFRPITESARLLSLHIPTYFYIFKYEGLLGRLSQGFNKVNDYKGVLHTEEMAYIFSRKDLPEASYKDKLIRARMVKMWTNFAKTKDPTPIEEDLLQSTKWPIYSESSSYLEINLEMEIKNNVDAKSIEFWSQMSNKYGKPPYDTY